MKINKKNYFGKVISYFVKEKKKIKLGKNLKSYKKWKKNYQNASSKENEHKKN